MKAQAVGAITTLQTGRVMHEVARRLSPLTYHRFIVGANQTLARARTCHIA